MCVHVGMCICECTTCHTCTCVGECVCHACLFVHTHVSLAKKRRQTSERLIRVRNEAQALPSMVETLAWASIGHPAFLGDLGQGPQVGFPASVCSVWKWGSHCPCPRPLLGVPALVPGRGEDSPKENEAEVLRELTSRTSMVPARPVFQSL